jgi:hypothetical protein
MALKGTLKDFGIADIFQLIGQQTKTGVLHLKARDEEVHIAFSGGNIVRADSSSRQKRDLLGTMLINAALISPGQLEECLDAQRRTLQRLGDILLEKRYLTAEKLKEMYQLQVGETVYRLFGWKSGTYEFEQGAVEFDAAMFTPIRSESVLMEGFRRVDEWPSIRRVLPNSLVSFERLQALPPLPAGAAVVEEEDYAIDEAFDPARERRTSRSADSLGRNERLVYTLAKRGITAQQIADRSRLGEFEASKALLSLINHGYLRVDPESIVEGGERAPAARLRRSVSVWATRAVLTAFVLVVLALLVYLLDVQRLELGANVRPLEDLTAQHLMGPTQRQRIASALAVYRLEKGSYPESLRDLSRLGLLSPAELRYPYGEEFFYERRGDADYLLLPPIR